MRRLADEMCTDMPDVQSEKAALVKRSESLREAQGWSREHLAEATGQTPEFIAAVESGDIAPPVAFILRLSGAYGVDPGTFLRDEQKEQIRDQRAQAYINRTRNYSYQTLTSGAARMTTCGPSWSPSNPTTTTSRWLTSMKAKSFIFVMEGELEFTLGSTVHTLKKGESIHFHSNTPTSSRACPPK
jgi:electron transfer flavoprotein alpha subunit